MYFCFSEFELTLMIVYFLVIKSKRCISVLFVSSYLELFTRRVSENCFMKYCGFIFVSWCSGDDGTDSESSGCGSSTYLSFDCFLKEREQHQAEVDELNGLLEDKYNQIKKAGDNDREEAKVN